MGYLTEALQYASLYMMVFHLLIVEMKVSTIHICQQMLSYENEVMLFLHNIMTINKTWAHLYDSETKHCQPNFLWQQNPGYSFGDTDIVYTVYFESGIRIHSECYTATLKILKKLLGRIQNHKK